MSSRIRPNVFHFRLHYLCFAYLKEEKFSEQDGIMNLYG